MQVCVRSIVIQIIDSLTGPRPPEPEAKFACGNTALGQQEGVEAEQEAGKERK